MNRKPNAKEIAQQEGFEDAQELFDMLFEIPDKLKCRSIFVGMSSLSQSKFLNDCKENDEVYNFYAYL